MTEIPIFWATLYEKSNSATTVKAENIVEDQETEEGDPDEDANVIAFLIVIK